MNGEPDLREYAAHVAKGSEVLWVDGIPWVSRGRVLRPLAMPHQMRPIHRNAIRSAMKQTGARLAQWTEDWDTEPCGWWHVCCDREDYDLGQLRKMVRYDVRRGLEQCDVRKVDPEWFAISGFPVYAAAFRRYGEAPPLTEPEFTEEFRLHSAYRGRETWGAFVGDTLVAWASCLVIEDAVNLASWKSDPAHYKVRPNNALLYVLTRHYLRERRSRYVMSGSRSLLHETNVQEFDEKMGYRKIYCPLRLELSPVTSLVNSLGLPSLARRLRFGKAFEGPIDRLEALAAAVRISRSCPSAARSADPAPSSEARQPDA